LVAWNSKQEGSLGDKKLRSSELKNHTLDGQT
jgi:hypothetical protein